MVFAYVTWILAIFKDKVTDHIPCFFWASCWNHCLAALDLGAGVEQPFNCLIFQQPRACGPWGARWIGHWRTTWSTDFFLRHTHRPQRRPFPVCTSKSGNVQHWCGGGWGGHRLILGGHSGSVGGGVGDENAEPCGVVRPLHIPLEIRPLRLTYVAFVRWTGEVLCSGYKW